MISLRRAARSARALLSRKLSPDALKIGVSPRIFHPQPDARGLQSKTLQYLEQSVAHWVMSRDVLVFMVPTVDKDGLLHRSNIRVADYARVLDGLVLQGGADVSPLELRRGAAARGVGRRPRARRLRDRAAARVRRGAASRCSASAAARS